MTLTDRLLKLADIWTKVQDRSLSRLATIVVNDGKFFSRVESGGQYSVAKWERFLAFFREPGNWPEAIIPADAAEILDEIQMIATGPEPFAGGEEVQLEAFLVSHKASDTEAAPKQSSCKSGEVTDSAPSAAEVA